MANLPMTVVQIKCLLSFMNEWNCRCYYFFVWIITIWRFCENFVFFHWVPDLWTHHWALAKVLFYEHIPVLFFLLLIKVYIKLWIMSYCLRYAYIITYIHTFIMVTFDTGTNFPAVNWNSLLAVAMMNIRLRWNGIGVSTQLHPNATSLTLSA